MTTAIVFWLAKDRELYEQPVLLYLGTLILDMVMWISIAEIFGHICK